MEWKETIAKDFCISVTDGTHDSPKPQSYGHYLITSKHLKESGIDFESANRISEEDYLKVIARSKVDQYDILFSMIGTVGTIYREVNPNIDYAVKNMAIFKLGGDDIKSKWLFYWLKNKKAKEYIHERMSGSTQGYLTLDSIRKYPIVYPANCAKMERIVSILSSLDRKIELNNKINAQLEEMAQALFKYWFVDFGPFKDGKFVECELGMIPEGWRVSHFIDIADLRPGGTPKTDVPDYWDGGQIPFFSPKDVTGVYCFDTEKHITELGLKNCSSQHYPCNTVFITCRGTVGKVTMAAVPMAMNQSNYAVVGKMGYTQYYIYFATLSIVNRLLKKANGAVFSAITSKDFKELIVVPDVSIVESFTNVVSPLFKKMLNIGKESIRLAQLRDTLLPRLMSGEIEL